jgi:hypothetical protein
MFGRFPDLRHPITYTDKVLYKSLYDRRPLLTLFADKYRVRDYVRKKVGDDVHFAHTYAVYDRWQDITLAGLPASFVMKPNHASGWIRFFHEGDIPSLADVRRTAREWLGRNFYHDTKEWLYKDIKPVVIFEELLRENGGDLTQFRFFCFNGQIGLIKVLPGPLTGRRRAIFDRNWNSLKVEYGRKFLNHMNLPVVEPKPVGFETMCRIAERLSSETDFVRVDLYNVDGTIYFGELTNIPGNGAGRFFPASFDREIGATWQLPDRYRA